MQSEAMKFRDLRLRDPILRFGVQKGTSIWLLCSSFSLPSSPSPFCVSLLTVGTNEPLPLFSFFFFLNSVLRKPHNEKDGFCFTHPSFEISCTFSLYSLERERVCVWRSSDKKEKRKTLPFAIYKNAVISN